MYVYEEMTTISKHKGSLVHVGGCQNHGPFLGPIIVRPLIFRVPKKGP